MVDLCESLAHWMDAIDASRAAPQTSGFMMKEVVQPMYEMLSQARSLRTDENLILQASCICIELKEVVSSTQFRPCCYSDLTCCQLMLGAVATKEGSPTRAWFTSRLSSAWRVVKSRGCNDPMGILNGNMVFKGGLGPRFKSLWVELDSQSLPQSELPC